MSSTIHRIRCKGEPMSSSAKINATGEHSSRSSLQNALAPSVFGRHGGTPNMIMSTRKQRFPQSKSVDDDEDNLSNESDFEDDDLTSPFTYSASRSRAGATGVTNKCDWCARMSTIGELTLVTQDKVSKSFCSEDCQDLYRDEVLRTKICEWCKRHFPKEPNLIVVEPSVESVPLQFCTQSCINKYKMELFCTEVKEQLRRIKEDNLQMPNVVTSKSSHERKILITPELWSEGESALVFIKGEERNESQKETNGSTKSVECGTNERKRKGNVMEDVISKLSRRHHRYTINPPAEPTKYRPPAESLTNPTNLTLQAANTVATEHRDDNFQSNKPAITATLAAPADGPYKQSKAPERPQQAKLWSNSMIIPFPILVPVPIPIPIAMQALSTSITKKTSTHVMTIPTSQHKQKQSTPNTHTFSSTAVSRVPVNPRSVTKPEKRYVLRKQFASDDPE